MMFLPRLLGFAAATLLVVPAAAQTVYRCGNDYGEVACAGGRTVDTEDKVTPERRRDAARVARSERSQGDEMALERRRQQAGRRPAAAASLSPAKAAAPAAKASAGIRQKKKTRGKTLLLEGDDFAAQKPKTPQTPQTPLTPQSGKP